MIRRPLLLAPLVISLMACDANGDPEASDTADQAGTASSRDNSDPALAPSASATSASGIAGQNDGQPDLTPAALTPEAERSETGARNVLLSFIRAIELREFDQAWALLDAQSQARWSKAQWTALFSDLGKITVASPTGTMEGAAGSSYYTAPLSITANDSDGRPVAYDGELILRRVNDVPGASAADLRWHIESLSLDWTH